MSCTAAHLRSRSLNIVSLSDMIEGSCGSWDFYTTGQLVDGLQQKRKPVFITRKWNHVVFSRATILSFHTVVIIVYYFQIRNRKEHNIIISRVISSHMGPIYTETPYIIPKIFQVWYMSLIRIELTSVDLLCKISCNTDEAWLWQKFKLLSKYL